MSKLAEFFYNGQNQYSMMRLISFLTSIGGMILIAFHPEQSMYLAPIIIGAQAFKWAQSKGGE